MQCKQKRGNLRVAVKIMQCEARLFQPKFVAVKMMQCDADIIHSKK